MPERIATIIIWHAYYAIIAQFRGKFQYFMSAHDVMRLLWLGIVVVLIEA